MLASLPGTRFGTCHKTEILAVAVLQREGSREMREGF